MQGIISPHKHALEGGERIAAVTAYLPQKRLAYLADRMAIASPVGRKSLEWCLPTDRTATTADPVIYLCIAALFFLFPPPMLL